MIISLQDAFHSMVIGTESLQHWHDIRFENPLCAPNMEVQILNLNIFVRVNFLPGLNTYLMLPQIKEYSELGV